MAENGTGTVTLPDGTVITVSGVKGEGIYLKAFPIPKESGSDSAWQWFAGQMEGRRSNMRPYDIWFEDAYGEVQTVRGTIRIVSAPPQGAGYKEPAVYSCRYRGTRWIWTLFTKDGLFFLLAF